VFSLATSVDTVRKSAHDDAAPAEKFDIDRS
jgi:hypothetical protein